MYASSSTKLRKDEPPAARAVRRSRAARETGASAVRRRAEGGALGPVESWRRRGGVGTRGLGWRDGIRDAGRLVPQLKAPRTGAGASVAASRGRRRGPLRAAGGGATRRGLRDAVVAA